MRYPGNQSNGKVDTWGGVKTSPGGKNPRNAGLRPTEDWSELVNFFQEKINAGQIWLDWANVQADVQGLLKTRPPSTAKTRRTEHSSNGPAITTRDSCSGSGVGSKSRGVSTAKANRSPERINLFGTG
jgi:hypothetical protein